jgi:hypothetical protein
VRKQLAAPRFNPHCADPPAAPAVDTAATGMHWPGGALRVGRNARGSTARLRSMPMQTQIVLGRQVRLPLSALRRALPAELRRLRAPIAHPRLRRRENEVAPAAQRGSLSRVDSWHGRVCRTFRSFKTQRRENFRRQHPWPTLPTAQVHCNRSRRCHCKYATV